jgi:GH24 family phage-related lysozyme (muramidase)
MATEFEKLKKVVLGFEGTKRNAYIPFKDGVVIGNSGVTIGKGLDLGQQNAASINALKAYGLSEELAKKLREHPDLGKSFKGKKKAEATFSPMVLTAEEEAQLNDSLVQKYKNSFEAAYEENVGRKPSEDLTENQRIALASAYFNLGNGLFKKKDKKEGSPTFGQFVPTDFTNQLKEYKFEDAAKNLGGWTDKATKYRRGAEAALFANQVDVDNTVAKRDQLNDKNPETFSSFLSNLKLTPEIKTSNQQIPYPVTQQGVAMSPADIRNYTYERDVRNYSGMEPGIQEAMAMQEPQFMSMEDLLMDKDLMKNPLLLDKQDVETMWRQF